LLDTRKKLLEIREKLDGRLLVGDGAVGTYLADRGIGQPYSRVYLMPVASMPQLARDVVEAIS
jgi:methionine synthase I (cobalamin-dependent)